MRGIDGRFYCNSFVKVIVSAGRQHKKIELSLVRKRVKTAKYKTRSLDGIFLVCMQL